MRYALKGPNSIAMELGSFARAHGRAIIVDCGGGAIRIEPDESHDDIGARVQGALHEVPATSRR